MELFSAEAETILKRSEEWLSHPEFELEATFGASGIVDAVTFLTVAQRLRGKGYRALPQEDRLTVTTPEHLRFTLLSLAVIQSYCEDDTMAGKPFVCQIKDRATAESTVDLEDYDVRLKLRRETLLGHDDPVVKQTLERWEEQRKAFRMIRRWTFEGDGLRFDMSIVRSTRKTRSGEFRWQRSFKDQDIMMTPPVYEIEVEVLRKPDDTPEAVRARVVKGVGEVLRGIQKHTLLIRRSVKEKVRAAYRALTGSAEFRGQALRVLMKRNFTKERQKDTPNIRDGYNVTDKADGLRCLAFVNEKGDLYLIDMGMEVYATGLRRPELRNSLVDGEWVTQTNDMPPKATQLFLAFDIFYGPDKKECWQYPFQKGAMPPALQGRKEDGAGAVAPPPPEDSRHFQLEAWIKKWNEGDGPKVTTKGLTAMTKLQVAMKEYHFAKAGDDSIFRHAARILSAARPYYTDGLIFTPNAAPLPAKPAATFHEQFKWKPPHDNTVDFLIRTAKAEGSKTQDLISIGVKPGTGETTSYKTLRLYVGANKDNARDLILNKRDLPPPDQSFGRDGKSYMPVLFTPKEYPDPYASICNLPIEEDPDTGEQYVMTLRTKEPIQDASIVEMSYDPSQPPGWRWRPERVRMDKTERFQRKIIARTLNSQKVADETWESFYDPITDSMIRTGAEAPTAEEMAVFENDATAREMSARRYYERPESANDNKITQGMRQFHNRWIKEQILYRAGLKGEDKKLLDLATGQANDLHIWRRHNIGFVLGLDYAAKNIRDPNDGAWARYLNVLSEVGSYDAMTPMAFAIADTSKSLLNPPETNGGSEEDRDILRAVLGRNKPTGAVPPFIQEYCLGALRTKADCVSCMFAIHYFFESPEKLAGLIRNIADTLKVGGYFIGCCFDGEAVFEALKGVAKDGSIQGVEKRGAKDVVVWNIIKRYDADELPSDDSGFGLGVDVEFITTGMGHREYLVPFKLLQAKLEAIGCELLSREELAEVGLQNSTNMFKESLEMAKTRGKDFPMGPAVQQFSFFNRWFVFRRKREETAAVAAVAEAEGAAAAKNLAAQEAVAAGRAAAAAGEGSGVVGATNVPAVRGNNRGRAANVRNAAAGVASEASELQRVAPAELGELAAKASALVPGSATAAPGGAGAGTNAARTVPVAPGPAAAAARTYKPSEVFLFYTDAQTTVDSLKKGDKGAGRWLAPSAPFAIVDPEDKTKIYPTMEHFVGAMRVKLASNKSSDPVAASGIAASIFGREGSIHQRFLQDRLVESDSGTRPLSEERDHHYTQQEQAAVKDAMRAPSLKKYGIVVDEALWAAKRDAVLEEALGQRWKRDKRFHDAVVAARDLGKYLLYYTPGSSISNVGGIRRAADGQIMGENRIGKIIMRLAGYPS